ncbi:MAG: HAD family hydrolase [Planctomycetota bacterium]|jgi:putative hydrolase of the HAD superfamily
MLPRGILFDLDDTIISFGAVADATWRGVCITHAGRCGLFTAEGLFESVGKVRRWYWSDPGRHRIGRMSQDATGRKIVSLAFESLGVCDPSLAREIADDFSSKKDEAMAFFPGAEDTLNRIAGRGVSLALVTNGEAAKQREKVARFRLERFFGTILIEGELGYGKPDAKVYRRALEALGLKPHEVWFVGDNLEWDVAGPQRLGIFAVWNDHRRKGLPSDSPVVPDRIIHGISELLE